MLKVQWARVCMRPSSDFHETNRLGSDPANTRCLLVESCGFVQYRAHWFWDIRNNTIFCITKRLLGVRVREILSSVA
jgi:hypothetical protein